VTRFAVCHYYDTQSSYKYRVYFLTILLTSTKSAWTCYTENWNLKSELLDLTRPYIIALVGLVRNTTRGTAHAMKWGDKIVPDEIAGSDVRPTRHAESEGTIAT